MRQLILFFLIAAFANALFGAADQGFDTSGVPHAPATPEPAAPKDFLRPDGLISTDALSKLIALRDPKIVLIDARSEADYLAGHLPGARNLPSDSLQDPATAPYFMLSGEA